MICISQCVAWQVSKVTSCWLCINYSALYLHFCTLSVHSSYIQYVRLVCDSYTLPLWHIYIQAPVRLVEPMWVKHTSHFHRKIYTYEILKPMHRWKFANESNSFLWTCWPLACWLKPSPALPLLDHMSSYHTSVTSSSHYLYQWSDAIFHSSSSIIHYKTSLLVVLTQQLRLNQCLTPGIQQCVCQATEAPFISWVVRCILYVWEVTDHHTYTWHSWT